MAEYGGLENPGEVKVKVYIGQDRFQQFIKDVGEIEGGACSPGKAADELHCTRQYIHKLLKQGKLRAWLYKERPTDRRVSYCYIAWEDIKEYVRAHGQGQPGDFQGEVDKSNRSVLG